MEISWDIFTLQFLINLILVTGDLTLVLTAEILGITRSCTWNKTNHKYHMRSQRYGFAQWANDHSFLLLGQHLRLQLRLRFIAPALCTPDGRWDVPIESLEQPNHQTLGAITLLSASLGVRQRGFQVGTLNGFLSLSCFYLLWTTVFKKEPMLLYFFISQYEFRAALFEWWDITSREKV